jgi:hypothetical protein
MNVLLSGATIKLGNYDSRYLCRRLEPSFASRMGF